MKDESVLEIVAKVGVAVGSHLQLLSCFAIVRQLGCRLVAILPEFPSSKPSPLKLSSW